MEKHIPADFDPNAPGINNGCYFGMPFTPEESKLVLFSVPWEVTASYGGGTAQAPDAILDASMQVVFTMCITQADGNRVLVLWRWMIR